MFCIKNQLDSISRMINSMPCPNWSRIEESKPFSFPSNRLLSNSFNGGCNFSVSWMEKTPLSEPPNDLLHKLQLSPSEEQSSQRRNIWCTQTRRKTQVHRWSFSEGNMWVSIESVLDVLVRSEQWSSLLIKTNYSRRRPSCRLHE